MMKPLKESPLVRLRHSLSPPLKRQQVGLIQVGADLFQGVGQGGEASTIRFDTGRRGQ